MREGENMGEMSVFATKFNKRSVSLREFDEVLRFLKQHKEVTKKLSYFLTPFHIQKYMDY